jgi:Rap1a immunity proteins
MRIVRWVTALALCAIAAPGAARAAVTEDTFQLRNTGDLIELCAAAQTDPLYTPAVNFCHGFAVGAFRVLNEVNAARPGLRLFCMTEHPPSRSEAIAAFVTWAKSAPDQADKQAEDSIAAYIELTYPCPHPTAHRAAPSRAAASKGTHQ